ncbi:MAG: 30S ribosomal protein S18 [Victivallaceae bacterium]|jgi:small subunit ribosomal protein S18|nr:30S ribosomal protein S18 [Victivallaceae bacterium]NLK82969.1 30S ribosomal protein S18 [Lentisphaerota bacterium]MDD3115881.1 30S ribosomal protein S18 [Victivallaceae bacterium]MDD3703205.1 30S ribosomal protein S18 [Victivallaceae bacterium]MDD4317086.1 30S ribosomal protein S18 [Victivallaceae bacterium]
MEKREKRVSNRKRPSKPKICRFCESKVEYVDFKDAEILKKFQTEKGKIMPRRVTGTCLLHQKMLCTAIKRARIVSLVY